MTQDAQSGMNVVEALQKGRTELLERGLWKGSYFEDEDNRDGRSCVKGALIAAGYGGTIAEYGPMYDFLLLGALKLFPERTRWKNVCCPVAQFNDHRTTTLNDALAVYDEAILLAKEDVA